MELRLFAQATIAIVILLNVVQVSTRIVDFGDKLTDLIKKHEDKNWLIKFYVPWCHYCQQLEPLFINAANEIYKKHDNLVIGQIDCTRDEAVCKEYGVTVFPAIVFLDKLHRIEYLGNYNSVPDIIDFVDRVKRPDITFVGDCSVAKAIANHHEMILISTERNFTSVLLDEFSKFAGSWKAVHWFYHFPSECDFINDEGVFMLKRHFKKPIKFIPEGEEELGEQLGKWVEREYFPAYGQLDRANFEGAKKSGKKYIIVAILDEYRPARRFLRSSDHLHRTFEEFALKHLDKEKEFLFTWSTDLYLMRYIAMTDVLAPNVMVVRGDLSCHLMITDVKDLIVSRKNDSLPEKLSVRHLERVIRSTKSGKLKFSGGTSPFYSIYRFIFSSITRVLLSYQSNPILALLLICFPIVTLLMVIYMTCFGDSPLIDNRFEPAEENQNQSNHHKRD